MRLQFCVLLLVFASACSAGLPRPTEAHVAAARAKEPNVGLADLERGRSLYTGKCAGCHALKNPEELPPDGWHPAVESMRNEHNVRLSDEQARDIVRYLESASAVARR